MARLLVPLTVLALALAGSASDAAGAAGDDSAPTAHSAKKKKCKKKGKKKARKCRRGATLPLGDPSGEGDGEGGGPPIVLPDTAPRVRMTASWSRPEADVDLHVYDAAGLHSGLLGAATMEDQILNGSHSTDVGSGPGSESFTDLDFAASGTGNREFSYYLCVYGTGTGSPTAVNLTWTTAAGGSATQTYNVIAAQGFQIPGGPPVHATSPCLV